MKNWTKRIDRGILLLAVFLAGAASVHATGIDATATYTDMLVSPGVYQYDLTLHNTGTTTIGTFWFSWIPGAGFLPITPSSVESPAGWMDAITNGGKSIQWTTASPLSSGGGQSGFQFDSTMTPAQLAGTFPGPGLGTGDPISTAFIYIAAPFGDSGMQITATPAVAAPEPGTLLLAALAVGLLAIGGVFRIRNRYV